MGVNLELMEEVLSFIDETRDMFYETELYTKYHVNPERYFTAGGCGHFYTILKAQFPQAVMYLTPGCSHVVTEIDGFYYDITGVVNLQWNWCCDIEDLIRPDADLEVVFENYAFTTNVIRGWRSTGPTGICMIQAIHDLNDEQRERLFNFMDEQQYDLGSHYKNLYERYYIIEDEDVLYELDGEAEGVIFPFAA